VLRLLFHMEQVIEEISRYIKLARVKTAGFN
jgi:hypothetical protein